MAHPSEWHEVLEGLDGLEARCLSELRALQVGRPVELQWKMQLGSPFGWWLLGLNSVTHNAGAEALSSGSTRARCHR